MPNADEIGQYVLITGNPIDGFVFIGPFRTSLKAHAYADLHCPRHTKWYIGEMLAPNQREGRLP